MEPIRYNGEEINKDWFLKNNACIRVYYKHQFNSVRNLFGLDIVAGEKFPYDICPAHGYYVIASTKISPDFIFSWDKVSYLFENKNLFDKSNQKEKEIVLDHLKDQILKTGIISFDFADPGETDFTTRLVTNIYGLKEMAAKYASGKTLDVEQLNSINEAHQKEKKILTDCIKNFLGILDTPLGRKRFPGEFVAEVIEDARNVLNITSKPNTNVEKAM